MHYFKKYVKILKFPYKKNYSRISKPSIISSAELIQEIKINQNTNKSLKIIECSLKDQFPENEIQECIPNSVYLNLHDISDNIENVPLKFSRDDQKVIKIMQKFDIGVDDSIICYDREGVYTSARLWFTLRSYGYQNIRVLEGGFNDWKNQNFPIWKKFLSKFQPHVNGKQHNNFNFSLKKEKICNAEQMFTAMMSVSNRMSYEDIIDARSPQRYEGQIEEPHKTLRRGSIRSAANIYYKELLTSDNKFKPQKELLRIFSEKNVDIKKNIIVYSGVGISACVVILALDLLGKKQNVQLYDGGWAEQGNIIEYENPILKKLQESRTFLDEYNSILGKMPLETMERLHKIDQIDYKRREILEKNKDYLKKKKKVQENDYSSPEEI
jgi:thiosulfate/3-mercaptopyruvate sulfurtransferase